MNITLPKGTYYLGDPTHVLEDKDYIGIWRNYYKHALGHIQINGFDFASYSTQNGDGAYSDTRNRLYNVETGIIALVHIDLIKDKTKAHGYGHIFTFENKVSFIYDIGYFIVKSGKKYIKIDTRYEDGHETDSEHEDQQCLNDNHDNISNTLLGDSDNDFVFEDGYDEKDDSDFENENKDKTIDQPQKPFKFFK